MTASTISPRVFAALLGISLVTAATARPQVDDWTLAGSIANSVRAPAGVPLTEHAKPEFNIIHAGAVSDGATDARPAIIATIEKAHAKGGRVVIPRGVWLCKGPLHLKSKVNLHLEKDAILLFSPDAADYLPPVLTRREGVEYYGYSPLIYGYQVQDVAITGQGVIDGNPASEFHKWAEKQGPDRGKLLKQHEAATPPEQRVYGAGTYLPPGMIQLIQSERVLLENVALNNAPFRAIHLAFTDHATARKLRIEAGRGNDAGIGLESATYALIESNVFRTGGSPLSIASLRDRDGREVRRPSAYIVVRDNDLGGGEGILFDGRMSGGIRNVFFADNKMRAGRYAMRFDADLNRGGAVEHVRVRNLAVESSEQFLFRFQLNMDSAAEYKGHPPSYRDIVFENVTVDSAGALFEARAPRQAPLQDVLLKNVAAGRVDSNFALENVEGLRLENVRIGAQTINGRLEWKEEAPEERAAR